MKESLQKKLGYTFDDESLLSLALTHRSHASHNNERLEFLGDSALGFIVAFSLYRQFPAAKEGQLTRLRAQLVKKETLAEVARELALGEHLALGSGELKSGGFDRDSILADSLEAVLGAILLDGGYSQAQTVALRWFEARLNNLSADDLGKDAKSLLQEHQQGRGRGVPQYSVIRTSGKSPDQEFEVACQVQELEAPVYASASSRRQAEQAAAARALQMLEVDR